MAKSKVFSKHPKCETRYRALSFAEELSGKYEDVIMGEVNLSENLRVSFEHSCLFRGYEQESQEWWESLSEEERSHQDPFEGNLVSLGDHLEWSDGLIRAVYVNNVLGLSIDKLK